MTTSLENAIAAERNTEKIAVEIKSFIGDSDILIIYYPNQEEIKQWIK